MLFSSITFLGFFFPVVLIAYYALPHRVYRNAVLLLASMLFYAWGEPKFVLLMLASVLFNYNMGIFIADRKESSKKFLIFAIAVNLGILFVFKYLGFSCQIVNYIIGSLHLMPIETINLILPIGISFYTFQEITYLVDVYKSPNLVQRNVLNLGLYITFFPQLIAGPIVRYHDINLQIENRSENLENIYTGFQRFIIGLSKKVLLANNLAFVCDSIYNADIFSYGTLAAWIAAISYALQIYYDFSGYSDMAIGLAKIFGFDLLENFNYPYAASSITDFWKRWHISLTNFFRDYVYIPLGGNRKSSKRTVLNRICVFFLTGLWHGASFNFIFWGLFHGISMLIERFFKFDKKSKESKLFSIFYRIITLLIIVLFWVLFRNGTKQTVKLWLKMFGINYSIFSNYHAISNTALYWFNVDAKFIIVLVIGVLFSFPWWKNIKIPNNQVLQNTVSILKCIGLVAMLGLCFAFLANKTYNPFIYFRF